jgi:hypothetical protein
MPKKNLFNLSRDSRGNWRRQNLGKVWKDGGWRGQTFYLGRDYAAARQRVVTLEKLWSVVAADWQKSRRTPCPCWDEVSLSIATAVARGDQEVRLAVPGEVRETAAAFGEEATKCVGMWLRGLQEAYPFVKLGLADRELDGRAGQAAGDLAAELEQDTRNIQQTVAVLRGRQGNGPTLVPALRAYLQHVHRKYGTAGYGKSYGNQVRFLIDNTEDVSLAALTADKLAEWAERYRQRPSGKRGRGGSRQHVPFPRPSR